MKNNKANKCHEILNARHVYNKNNQVYVKSTPEQINQLEEPIDIWVPIHFQWK